MTLVNLENIKRFKKMKVTFKWRKLLSKINYIILCPKYKYYIKKLICLNTLRFIFYTSY